MQHHRGMVELYWLKRLRSVLIDFCITTGKLTCLLMWRFPVFKHDSSLGPGLEKTEDASILQRQSPIFDHLQYAKQRRKLWEGSSYAVTWDNERYMQPHRRWCSVKNLKVLPSNIKLETRMSKCSVTTAPGSAHSRLNNIQFVNYNS